MTDRGTRRHQKERNLNRWRKIVSGWFKRPYGTGDAETLARKFASHGKLCSCYMCGNPRRHFDEPTMQEKRADNQNGDA